MTSRAQRRREEQQSFGRSAGFTWLLGGRSSRDDSAKLAALAFGAQGAGLADAADATNSSPGWGGPSAAATGWAGAEVGHGQVLTPHKLALGMEAEEEEDPALQMTKEDGFLIRQFKNGWYKGEMLKGSLEGHGHFAFANGESYEGEWVNNRMSGRGVYTYKDGSQYEGDYMAGKKHGVGRYTPALGESYMTRYEHGKLIESGEATIVSSEPGVPPCFTSLTRDLEFEQQEGEEAEQHNEPVGVGIKFKAVDGGGLEVCELLAGGPAFHDGRIAIGDRLFAVDSKNVYHVYISDVLPVIRGAGGSSVKLEFDRETGDGHHMQYTVTLQRHSTQHVPAPKSILSSMKPSKQLYHLPLELKPPDSESDEEEPGESLMAFIKTSRGYMELIVWGPGRGG